MTNSLHSALRIALALFLLESGLSACVCSQANLRNKGKNLIPLCEVLRSPEQYDGKEISTFGTYRVAEEAAELYCLSCLGNGRIWVSFESAEGAGKGADKALHVLRGRWGTVNGIFTGIFHANGSYGHLAAFRHEIVLDSIQDVKLIDRLGFPPSTLTQASRAKVCK